MNSRSDASLNPKQFRGRLILDQSELSEICRASRLEATFGVPYLLTIEDDGLFVASRRGDAVSGGGDAVSGGYR